MKQGVSVCPCGKERVSVPGYEWPDERADGCLGVLLKVSHACCGHFDPQPIKTYVSFDRVESLSRDIYEGPLAELWDFTVLYGKPAAVAFDELTVFA